MNEDLRAKIIAHNKQAAARKAKADDLDELMAKLKPIIVLIAHLLPDEVKAILEKYGITHSTKKEETS